MANISAIHFSLESTHVQTEVKISSMLLSPVIGDIAANVMELIASVSCNIETEIERGLQNDTYIAIQWFVKSLIVIVTDIHLLRHQQPPCDNPTASLVNCSSHMRSINYKNSKASSSCKVIPLRFGRIAIFAVSTYCTPCSSIRGRQASMLAMRLVESSLEISVNRRPNFTLQ